MMPMNLCKCTSLFGRSAHKRTADFFEPNFYTNQRVAEECSNLKTFGQVTTGNGIRGRRCDRRESTTRIQHILNGDFRHLRDWQLALCSVRFRHDVRDAGTMVTLGRTVVVGPFRLWFHRSKSWCVVERQMTDRRQMQIAGAQGSQPR